MITISPPSTLPPKFVRSIVPKLGRRSKRPFRIRFGRERGGELHAASIAREEREDGVGRGGGGEDGRCYHCLARSLTERGREREKEIEEEGGGEKEEEKSPETLEGWSNIQRNLCRTVKEEGRKGGKEEKTALENAP